jgi:hypothetical protein
VSNDLIGYAPGACLRAAWAFSQFFIPWKVSLRKVSLQERLSTRGNRGPSCLLLFSFAITMSLSSQSRPVAAAPAAAETASIEVIRRDGSAAPLHIGKIRTVVDWACRGLDANAIELEKRVT